MDQYKCDSRIKNKRPFVRQGTHYFKFWPDETGFTTLTRSCPVSHTWDICKQSRPRSDAASELGLHYLHKTNEYSPKIKQNGKIKRSQKPLTLQE